MKTTHQVEAVHPDHALLAGFHASWQIIQHSGPLHLRMYLANLLAARSAMLHLAHEIDKLIAAVEGKLAHYEAVDAGVRAHEAV